MGLPNAVLQQSVNILLTPVSRGQCLRNAVRNPSSDIQTVAVSWQFSVDYIKGKAIPLQAWTGPEVSRRLRLPDFKIIGT